jgi:hypothetical protein
LKFSYQTGKRQKYASFFVHQTGDLCVFFLNPSGLFLRMFYDLAVIISKIQLLILKK